MFPATVWPIDVKFTALVAKISQKGYFTGKVVTDWLTLITQVTQPFACPTVMDPNRKFTNQVTN